MATWAELDQELQRWADAGETPTFWWRDDDTQAPSAELDRLIALAERFDAPLHLAVIPHNIASGLASRLRASPGVYSMQHGFAHKNHEARPLRASEIGVSRDLEEMGAELREGWRRMQAAGLPNLLPVMVPPWNQIGEQALPKLPEWGYAALSNFYPRPNPAPVPGLQHFNGHIDPIRWKDGARFAGDEKTLLACVEHLQQRRSGALERDEPTGFVTHHLQTDEDTWAFTEAFMARLTHQGAGHWLSLDTLLGAR